MIAPADRLIVALDVPSADEARAVIAALGDAVTFYKLGLELQFAGGLELARDLAGEGKRVFLDAKLLDIGHTVERATARAAALGATFLTVHGTDRRTLQAAVAGRAESDLRLLAVTVMTSLGQDDLAEQGIEMAVEDLVLRRATMAAEAGFDGVIASGHEAARIRAAVGPDLVIVTPGIRPAGAALGDQARVMTPAKAIEAGADYLVVGRPILQADDPRGAARAIQAEIAAALQQD